MQTLRRAVLATVALGAIGLWALGVGALVSDARADGAIWRNLSPFVWLFQGVPLSATYFPTPIKTIQRGSITINGAASNTATITSVGTGNSRLRWLGQTSTSGSLTADKLDARVDLTNATTVTATVVNAPGTAVVVSYEVDEYLAQFVKSLQRGTIVINTNPSGTATITAVATGHAEVDLLGYTNTAVITQVATQQMSLTLTNSTTVTASLGSGGGNNTAGFQVLEWK